MRKYWERFKSFDHYHKSLYLFIAIMLAAAVAWGIQQIIRVNAFGFTFFSNTAFGSYDWDYYMDYFNVNTWVWKNGNPYPAPMMSSYPPLALAIAKFFAMFGYYGTGSLGAREVPSSMISYYVMFAIFTILTMLAIVLYGKKKDFSWRTSILLAIALIFSAPYVYLYGRGNYLVVAITAIAWFFLWYDSDKKWKRELALWFLAIAAGIKLYPALLAAILLKDRRYRDFVKTVIYTILLFFLPFLCFPGGFSNLGLFLHNLLDFQGTNQASAHNYSVPTFLYYFAQIFHGCKLSYVPQWIITAGGLLSYVFLLVSLFFSLFCDKAWKSFALITLGVVFFPAPSYVYSLCMILPVIAMFLLTKEKNTKDYIYLALFITMIFLPQFGFLVKPEYVLFGMNINNFLQHLAMMTMFGMLLYDSFKNALVVFKKIVQSPSSFLSLLKKEDG